MTRFLVPALALAFSAPALAGDLPDPQLTPGVVNPAVTQGNIVQTICVPGWTKTIRPAASYTDQLKRRQMQERGLAGNPADYEEDHLISLEIGGHPTDPANLWPQPWNGEWGAHRKDVIETKLKRLVCAGSVTLDEAQTAIRTDWVAAYRKYVGGATP